MPEGHIPYPRDRKVRRGFGDDQNSQGSEYNVLPSPNSPLSKAMCLIFEGMGFVHHRLCSCHSDEEKSSYGNEIWFSSEFLVLLISTSSQILEKITHFFLFQLHSLRAYRANSLQHELQNFHSGVTETEAGLHCYSLKSNSGSVYQIPV